MKMHNLNLTHQKKQLHSIVWFVSRSAFFCHNRTCPFAGFKFKCCFRFLFGIGRWHFLGCNNHKCHSSICRSKYQTDSDRYRLLYCVFLYCWIDTWRLALNILLLDWLFKRLQNFIILLIYLFARINKIFKHFNFRKTSHKESLQYLHSKY